MIERAARRLRQGFAALGSFARPVDTAAVAKVLTHRQMALFYRMRRSEQQHCLRVMRTLQAQGHTHPDLLTAALLHDVGKARYPLNLFERSFVVLARALLPERVARWGEGEPCGWRRAFVIARQHPDWSAEEMLAAGASPLAVALACRHQEPDAGEPQDEEDRLLLLLQAADRIS